MQITLYSMKFQFLRITRDKAAELNIASNVLERHLAHFVLVQIIASCSSFQSNNFFLKGGASLGWRFPSKPYRETQDLDFVVKLNRIEIRNRIEELEGLTWGRFRVGAIKILGDKTKSAVPLEERIVEARVPIQIGISEWVSVRLEVLPLVEPVETEALEVSLYTDVLDGMDCPKPVSVPVMSLERQIAEKLHGLTDPDSDRVRDLFDLYHLGSLALDVGKLRVMVADTYDRRATHIWDSTYRPTETQRELYSAKFGSELDFALAFDALASLQALIGPLE